MMAKDTIVFKKKVQSSGEEYQIQDQGTGNRVF